MEWPFCPLCTCSRRRLSLLPAGRGMTPPELTGERIEQQWPCDLREILIGRLRKRPGKAVNRVQEKKSRRTPTYSLTESPSETFTRPRLIPDIKKMDVGARCGAVDWSASSRRSCRASGSPGPRVSRRLREAVNFCCPPEPALEVLRAPR